MFFFSFTKQYSSIFPSLSFSGVSFVAPLDSLFWKWKGSRRGGGALHTPRGGSSTLVSEKAKQDPSMGANGGSVTGVRARV